MIKEDMSYLSDFAKRAIECGYAELDVFSLRIDRQHEPFVEGSKEEIASKVEILVESLSKKFDIYQYKDGRENYNRNWDLFFWCNCNNGGRDYSYITLNFNKKRTLEERLSDKETIVDAIKGIGFEGLDITIQYTTKFIDEKITDVANKYFETIKDKSINIMGMDGKIKMVGNDFGGNTCYGFFKKRSKKKYYPISEHDMLIMALNW